MMVSCQLDSNTSASINYTAIDSGNGPSSVDYTITGSDIGPSPSSKYFIQKNVYESVKCSNDTQFVRPRFVK